MPQVGDILPAKAFVGPLLVPEAGLQKVGRKSHYPKSRATCKVSTLGSCGLVCCACTYHGRVSHKLYGGAKVVSETLQEDLTVVYRVAKGSILHLRHKENDVTQSLRRVKGICFCDSQQAVYLVVATTIVQIVSTVFQYRSPP